jgi:uncharacterized protein (DUF58 family)
LIYPTRASILTAAAGVPVALLVGVFAPNWWHMGIAWPVAILLLTLVDAMTGVRPASAQVRITVPRTASVGGDVDAHIQVTLPRSRETPPVRCEFAIEGDKLLRLANDGQAAALFENGTATVVLPMIAVRRGVATMGGMWLRWRGSLGLSWKQRHLASDARITILPDIRPVHERGAQLFQRHALQGLIAQLDRGDGVDFDSLVEFRAGMDRRAIDWKQSARHMKLHAREYRSERNNQIMFAIDSGRQMSEPVAGLPRVDRAVSAMLLAAWVALKLGDRVALTAFDSRPRIVSGLVTRAAGFSELQHLAAGIDYSAEETNYTFALTTLASRLTRRSLIILFTEFTDIATADFLVRASARLIETHLLLIVVLRDEELESIIDHPPAVADDVARAVTAAALLKDRRIVLTRLRHLGAHVIECDHDRVNEQLVAAYVDLKRRNLL